ncbi:Helix-turn-helix [Solimonas aquatica]|uniref:Helix-turn-helix n=1 Tax=Solimonas aquatica TaxID=489703 RepID=A0A1H9A6K9_9GAMM|nr:helix-turn-helix transcriptional regulator [Solimonas aquatica]SEP72376.1 Helix-turn-helix [Solimonas aquatica]
MPANVEKRNPLAVAFGKALRAARDKTDLSQEGLGLACGIDRTYVSMLERGERQPTLTTVFALCAELGIHPEQLVAETRQAFRKGTR